jgi:hypothetical protein
MSGIPALVAQALQGDTLRQLSRAVGAPEGQTRDAALAALPVMLGQMRRNAGTPQGAQALGQALDRDHDGGLLDNLGPLIGMLGGGGTSGAAGGAGGGNRALNGGGILGHIFGGRQPEVEQGVAQASGLDRGQVGRLLLMLAPLVMSALARQRRQQPEGGGELPDLLGRATQDARRQAPGGLMGALGGLLDRDGDGGFMDDLAGGLLGGRK